MIKTRFAPSPTGELHIGGARTALFCYLWAKKNQGQFILRIEDTDQERNKEEFVNNLYKDLVWLGVKPDESIFQTGEHGPYRQTQRLDIYRKYIEKLLEEKKAYYCFCSPEELAQEKERFIRENKRSNYQYSRKCLQLSEKEIHSFLRQQTPYVLRLKIPQERNYSFPDLVRKEVNFQGKDIEDFVLFRQNSIPNFNFACAVDDYLMKISHVLRGEEHLSNTGKQLVLYEMFGWNPPFFSHISIILNKEKKKLSKRDKETSQWQLISQLREKGYLPSAIVNYLLFLGWHPGNNQEIFSLSEAIKIFNLEGFHASGAVYDLEKLNWYNNHYIRQLPEKDFAEHAWQFLGKKYDLEPKKKAWVKQISLLFRPQLNNFQELIDLTTYFFQRPAPKVEIKENEVLWIEELRKELSKLDKWEVENIKSVLKSACLNNQAPKKEFYLLVRNLLTGVDKGPELPQIIYLLNKLEINKRFNISLAGRKSPISNSFEN
ncbi:glutamate--tRNA ligase [endosymbiont GvMRE of Glomus versiforme]|uniref:glutamate--tRNA ligase n=1 Tax=endosymbiont GvMRE of Glomus versiforme TaxID=2039283 RepID=UPI000EC20EA8|nr:glutamate--tRNA ligase [endosymbiont GvMRE of Glomus versiforme]RHZ35187.1 Glutamate--tRNA ligase [endosymbiont GvMRE of Glomus versiforme]